MNEPRNPCSYKNVCKICLSAELNDRPYLCKDLACPEYTPCKQCQANRTLDDQSLCGTCVKKNRQQQEQILTQQGELLEVQSSHVEAVQESEDVINDSDVPGRTLTITRPGTPPQEYSEDEKDQYNSQWKEYTSFYRDPTSRTILHNIIIFEIELNWNVARSIELRGVEKKEVVTERTRLIRVLGELRDQLPQKEANEESDDERFFSMIYESYVKEKSERNIGKVTRLFSPEALALAPHLTFPVNPPQILRDLGYRSIDAIEACNHILLDELPTDPKKMLEFLGFFLDEQYALPGNTPMATEEESLPAIGNFQTSVLMDANETEDDS